MSVDIITNPKKNDITVDNQTSNNPSIGWYAPDINANIDYWPQCGFCDTIGAVTVPIGEEPTFYTEGCLDIIDAQCAETNPNPIFSYNNLNDIEKDFYDYIHDTGIQACININNRDYLSAFVDIENLPMSTSQVYAYSFTEQQWFENYISFTNIEPFYPYPEVLNYNKYRIKILRCLYYDCPDDNPIVSNITAGHVCNCSDTPNSGCGFPFLQNPTAEALFFETPFVFKEGYSNNIYNPFSDLFDSICQDLGFPNGWAGSGFNCGAFCEYESNYSGRGISPSMPGGRYVSNSVNNHLKLISLVCNSDITLGCTDPSALNYNPLVLFDDGSCTYDTDGDGVPDNEEIFGCTDESALNYNPLATEDDGSCEYVIDSDGDGVPDELEVMGCTDEIACNYNEFATEDDGSCIYPIDSFTKPLYNPQGYTFNPITGIVESFGITLKGPKTSEGDTMPSSITYDLPELSCVYIPNFIEPTNNNYPIINASNNPIVGCVSDFNNNNQADYFIETRTFSNTTQTLDKFIIFNLTEGYDCSFLNNQVVLSDHAGNFKNQNTLANTLQIEEFSSNDLLEICSDPTACNFNWEYDFDPLYSATFNNCQYPIDIYGVDYVDCNNECINDDDNDGVCNEDELPGCTSPTACNYNELATDDDGSCNEPLGYTECFYDNDGDGFFEELFPMEFECLLGADISETCAFNNAGDLSGVLSPVMTLASGCTNSQAINFSQTADQDDGSCQFQTFAEFVSDFSVSEVIENSTFTVETPEYTFGPNTILNANVGNSGFTWAIATPLDAVGINVDLEIISQDANGITISVGDVELDAVFVLYLTIYVVGDTGTSYMTLSKTIDIKSLQPTTIVGDVNFDEEVNVADIVQIVNHIIGQNTLVNQAFQNADINGDGVVNVSDVVQIIQNSIINQGLLSQEEGNNLIKRVRSDVKKSQLKNKKFRREIKKGQGVINNAGVNRNRVNRRGVGIERRKRS